MRSISAAARRMERNAERQRKHSSKMHIANQAAQAVADWETYTEELQSLHLDFGQPIDWRQLTTKPAPREPDLYNPYADKALAAISAFKPSVLDVLRGGSAKRLKKLENALLLAKQEDAAAHRKVQQKYTAELTEWQNDKDLATRLLNGNEAAKLEVLREMGTLAETGLIGTSIKFEVSEDFVHARPQVHSDTIIPKVRRKQLDSGRLSETKMPAGQFNELYQDYIASVAFRVAGEIFQMLPISEVFVTCEADMLDTSTGYKRPTPILSVKFVRETMFKLALSTIDPSDALNNFSHEMKFSKTKGFSPIIPLTQKASFVVK